MRIPKVNKTILNLLKILLFLLVLFVFYKQLIKVDLAKLKEVDVYHLWYGLIVIVLMPVNWLFEWFKWKIVLKEAKLDNTRFKFSAFVSGIAISTITPNRIGNFIGRMLWFSNNKKPIIAYATLYSNSAQFLASLLLGYLSFYVVLDFYPDPDWMFMNYLILFFPLGFIIYFLLPNFLLLFKFKWSNFLIQTKPAIKRMSVPFLVLSALRFVVFSCQYYLLAHIFYQELQLSLIFGISFMFFLTTLTPSLMMGKLIIRETYALFILAPFIDNEFVILFVSLGLWILNLGIPALIGVVNLFFLRSKNV